MKKLKDKKRALVVVAHPDDETIWMGGTILKNQKVNWTIFSLCRRSDKDRAPKFFKVCKYYKAKAIMTDLDDEDKLTIKQTTPVIKNLVLEKIGNKKFDYIFFHGRNGEYGHDRHIGVHEAVYGLIQDKKLNPSEGAICFNYRKIGKYKLAPKKASDLIIKLTKKEFERKKKVMTNIYGFDPKGIDTNLCTNKEGFKIIKMSS